MEVEKARTEEKVTSIWVTRLMIMEKIQSRDEYPRAGLKKKKNLSGWGRKQLLVRP